MGILNSYSPNNHVPKTYVIDVTVGWFCWATFICFFRLSKVAVVLKGARRNITNTSVLFVWFFTWLQVGSCRWYFCYSSWQSWIEFRWEIVVGNLRLGNSAWSFPTCFLCWNDGLGTMPQHDPTLVKDAIISPRCHSGAICPGKVFFEALLTRFAARHQQR